MTKKTGTKIGGRIEFVLYQDRGNLSEEKMREVFTLLHGTLKKVYPKLKLGGIGELVDVVIKDKVVNWTKI